MACKGRGDGERDLLLSLPKPVLQMVLAFVEDRPEDRAPSKTESNRLLRLRLVSKSMRAVVDEGLSYLTCQIWCDFMNYESVGKCCGELAPVFISRMPRWKHLIYLHIDCDHSELVAFALSLVGSSCPNLLRLTVRGQVLSGTLPPIDLTDLRGLQELRLQLWDMSVVDTLATATSLRELALYDVKGQCIVSGPNFLESLVLGLDICNAKLVEDAVISMCLKNTSLRFLQVHHHPLHKLQVPTTLTSLSLVKVSCPRPDWPLGLTQLLTLELEDVLIGGQISIPTGLTTLSLTCHTGFNLPLATRPMDTLPNITNLQELILRGMSDIHSLSDIHALSQLATMRLIGLKSLTCIQALNSLSSLKSLEINDCPVTQLPSLDGAKSLTSLCLRDLSSLVEDVDLRGMTSLVELELCKVRHMRLGDNLRLLCRITYSPCKDVHSLPLPALPKFQEITLEDCKALFRVYGLRQAVLTMRP